ncbi:N-acetylmuramoyl-L-alanine amidase [Mesobacillus persicus]|uniref:N-acetylmuramoyl-L-alanine amidase n=1 Tax=Mesobacillus persicus TaxID=930146 RepID=A0A1H8A526_9BACI|nr:cell wall-binding repeat-containing protein [Mesobacillus persicus]SEM65845.1 N-acetylmuramoyl-L-alanine amidase [Mesobacillus persicus]
MKSVLLKVIILLSFFVFFTNFNVNAEVVTQRFDGKDRFQVAVAVSKEGWPNGANTVVLTNYKAFADALSGASLAYKENAPILLTTSNKLETASLNEIKRLNPSKVILIGGSGSVSDEVVTTLKELGIQDIERIGGKDRFEVAYHIAKRLGTTQKAVIANGMNFPDALAIAPYAAKSGYPILLTRNNELPIQMGKAIKELNIRETIISGGEASVSKSVANQLPNVKRIGGSDRYEVSVNIVNQLTPSSTKVFFATGTTFADALTGSVLAAKQDAALLLTHPTYISPTTQKLIVDKSLNDFAILGGTGSIPESTFLKLVGQAPIPPLEGKTIILDVGHGGSDPGAVQNGILEKDVNNKFSLKLASKLEGMGAKILYTRNPKQDVYISLPDRAVIANKSGADLLISIHHDSNNSSQPRGLSTHYSSYRPAINTKDVYVLSGGKKYPFVKEITEKKVFVVKDGSTQRSLSYMGNNIAYDPTPTAEAQVSKVLAERFANALIYPGIGISKIYSSTGTKDHNLYITRWTNMPSVLIELGFISNPDEAKLLKNESIQEKRAKALAESVREYYSK